MTEPRDPVPGTGRHGKGGADRKTRIKHGAARRRRASRPPA